MSAMPFEAMSLRWPLGLADHLLPANRNGAKIAEQNGDCHRLIAMGAQCAGSKPTSKSTALVAALVAKEPGITFGALVDDGRRWETAGKIELELVGWSLSETNATLAASVRAVGLATSSWEMTTAHAAHTRLAGSRSIVTQRSFP